MIMKVNRIQNIFVILKKEYFQKSLLFLAVKRMWSLTEYWICVSL